MYQLNPMNQSNVVAVYALGSNYEEQIEVCLNYCSMKQYHINEELIIIDEDVPSLVWRRGIRRLLDAAKDKEFSKLVILSRRNLAPILIELKLLTLMLEVTGITIEYVHTTNEPDDRFESNHHPLCHAYHFLKAYC